MKRAAPRRSLNLRDRGYVDIGYFEALSERAAYLICRATNALNPTIVEVISGLPRSAQWLDCALECHSAQCVLGESHLAGEPKTCSGFQASSSILM